MEQVWQFAGSAKEDEPFEIKGVEVWNQGWEVVEGEEAHVHDPVYGKTYVFRVFCIQDDDQKIEFAAGDFRQAFGGFTQKNKGIQSSHNKALPIPFN